MFFFSFGGRSCAKILGKVQKRPPTLSHYKSAIQKARQKGALWLRAHVVDGQLSHKMFPGVPYFPLNPGCFFSGSLYWLTYYNLHINGYIMDSMIPYIPSIYPKQSVFFFIPSKICDLCQAPGRSCLRALLGSAKAVTAGVDSIYGCL